jgi:hypothetical protein
MRRGAWVGAIALSLWLAGSPGSGVVGRVTGVGNEAYLLARITLP